MDDGMKRGIEIKKGIPKKRNGNGHDTTRNEMEQIRVRVLN